jgi:hypothetical protein
VFELGRTALRNVQERAEVSLLWPPIDEAGYDLIVNGTVTLEQNDEGVPNASAALSKAVLHQPGFSKDPASSCEADCQPLTLAG